MPPHPSCEAGAPRACNPASASAERRALLATLQASAFNTAFVIAVIAEPREVLLRSIHIAYLGQSIAPGPPTDRASHLLPLS